MSEKHKNTTIHSKQEKQPNYRLRQSVAGFLLGTLALTGGWGITKATEYVARKVSADRTYNPQEGNPPYAEEMAQRGLYGDGSMESDVMTDAVKNEKDETVYYIVQVGDTPSELVEKFGGKKADVDAISRQGEAEYHMLAAGQRIKVPKDMAEAVILHYQQENESPEVSPDK